MAAAGVCWFVGEHRLACAGAAVAGAGLAAFVYADRLVAEVVVLPLRLGHLFVRADPLTWCWLQYEFAGLVALERGRIVNERVKARLGVDPYWEDTSKAERRMAERVARQGGMMADPTPVLKDLVLVGGGHTHAFVLRSLGMNPIPGVQVTLITREMSSPYSGMLPGFVAGHYSHAECHLNMAQLGRFAQARVVHCEAAGVDRERRLVHLGGGRPPVAYDVLSIDIGSTPATAGDAAHDGSVSVTGVKPVDGFGARWAAILERTVSTAVPLRLVVVGAGAGGVELVLAMQYRLREELQSINKDPTLISCAIVSRNATVMPSHSPAVQRIFLRLLRERGVTVHLSTVATGTRADHVETADGGRIEADECIWCTQAGAAAWLADTGLQLTADGFVAVEDTLESCNTPGVFAAGDCAAVLRHPRPKAGVFAVRQGPPLAANLRAALLGQALEPFEPQSLFLGLISTGDPALCVASRGPLAVQGAWLFRLKDYIDRRWMAIYTTNLPRMPEAAAVPEVARHAGPEALAVLQHATMRCGGCGAKVGATVLSDVLRRLDVPTRPEVLVGLDSPDDCAVVAAPGPGQALVSTVDFFRSFWGDPYVFGRIATNHALSDVHAMCAEPVSALAIAVVPFAHPDKVAEQLHQLMAGACQALRESNCALAGGHSCEGRELSLGLAVTGVAEAGRLLRKGGMQPGDALILTKPLGTGTLFAAEMRLRAAGTWVEGALASMLKSNRDGGLALRDHGATACTDVTGFGLLGHLLEMCRASGASASLDLARVPALDGALECIQSGVFSSLQDANLRLRHGVLNAAEAVEHRAYPLLYDPQTAGGLLASVPAERARDCVRALRAAGYPRACVIGRVVEATPDSVGVHCNLL